MSKQTTEMLTKEEVMEVFNFANYLYNSNIFGYYTPDMSNQNLINLNNNPLIPTVEKVRSALANYKTSADELQGYSEFMEVFDNIYKRAVDYLAGMLKYDLDIDCINAFTDEDFKSKAYKDDLNRVYKFLDNFDYIGEFQRVTKQLLRHEIDYTWLRDSKGTFNDDPENPKEVNIKRTSKYTLQEMPQKYCKVTAKWEHGLLYDLDMNYFINGGVSIEGYDPSIMKVFKKIYVDGKPNEKYIPTEQLKSRNGSFAMWSQTSPYHGAWVFKRDMSNMAIVPYLSSIIPDLLDSDYIRGLQKNKDIIGARALLVGEIQLLDKQKSGNSTDALSYNPKTLMKFLKLVKQGLADGMNAVAMPTKDPKLYQFKDENTDMVENNLKTTVGRLISGSRMIYSTDKLSETEAKCVIINDYNIVKPLYTQFNNFLNYFVNRKTKKYKFRFTLDGCTYPFVNEKKYDNLLALMDKGVVLAPRTYAKLVDMKPNQFDRLLREGHASEWSTALTSVMQSIYTQSDNDAKGEVGEGRPKVSDSEISDKGAESREYGG